MSKKILLLRSPLADYSVACLWHLAQKPGLELYPACQAAELLAPYDNPGISFCRQRFVQTADNADELVQFCCDLLPDTISMASCNHALYMRISRECRQQGTYTVSVFNRFESWGLIVHEASTAGLAAIASHQVGATTYYICDGQNGYLVNPDAASLLRAMRLAAETNDAHLAAMRATSQKLASLWTLQKWACHVLFTIIFAGTMLNLTRQHSTAFPPFRLLLFYA